mmetsp:Transcript_34268/g.87013  ORF Transcript_34268/g.87013 Transcript_34268/m.87013 type:complete len:267 (+) Transcript_34268:377-1177(+)
MVTFWTSLPMAHLSIHDIKEYIQLCLHDVLLRGLMEDVSEPAIAAKLYAINLLLRLQPREVAHSEIPERRQCHRPPTIQSAGQVPLWQPGLRLAKPEPTLSCGHHSADVLQHHVAVKIHEAPEGEKRDVRAAPIFSRKLERPLCDDWVAKREETGIPVDTQLRDLRIGQGDVVKLGSHSSNDLLFGLSELPLQEAPQTESQSVHLQRPLREAAATLCGDLKVEVARTEARGHQVQGRHSLREGVGTVNSSSNRAGGEKLRPQGCGC